LIARDSWRSRCTAAFQDFSRFALPAVQSVGVAELPSADSEPLALAALDREVETGSHAELMASSGRYAELFNLQAAAYR